MLGVVGISPFGVVLVERKGVAIIHIPEFRAILFKIWEGGAEISLLYATFYFHMIVSNVVWSPPALQLLRMLRIPRSTPTRYGYVRGTVCVAIHSTLEVRTIVPFKST